MISGRWIPLIAVALTTGLLPGCSLFSRTQPCDPCLNRPAEATPFATAQPLPDGLEQSPALADTVLPQANETAPTSEVELPEPKADPTPRPIQQTSFPDPVHPETPQAHSPILPFTPPPPLAGAEQSASPLVRVERVSAAKQEPLVEAMRHMLNDRPKEALELLERYDRPTQDFLVRVLPALARIHQSGLEGLKAEEVAMLHEQFQAVIALLRPRTEFAIGTLCFCKEIRPSGFYEQLPADYVFLAASNGRPGELVQVYVQLKNVCSAYQAPHYETRLALSAEIFDQKGNRRWRDPEQGERKAPERAPVAPTDSWRRYIFPMPALEPGTYLLRIQVTDETHPGSTRVACKSLEFRVSNLPRQSE